jgi:DNA (cytosine-5)-methyltransferase 1
MMPLFPYKWYLKDGYPSKGIEKNNLKVFGTFICGGGSTMGYKLAGFDHLGGVEIDKQVVEIYKLNHSPKYLFNEDLRLFNERTDIPDDLYNLDILDGSPPCSTFSMAGSREKAWNKKKKFREGQAMQTLDDLVFVYCETIIKLQPKVAILENVKGILQGNAKKYCKNIVKKLESNGYDVQIFLLNAASMGVPQKRERVFFICKRKDLKLPKLALEFNENPILFKEIESSEVNNNSLTEPQKKWWELCPQGSSFSKIHPKGHWFNAYKVSKTEVCPTLAATGGNAEIFHPETPRKLNVKEYCFIGSFPLDYNFSKIRPLFLIGMSVPPVMMAQIANQIKIQYFS